MNKSNYDREIKRRVKKRKKDAQKAQDESMKNKKSGKYKQRRKCGTKIRHHKNKVYEESKKWPKKSGRGKNHMKVTKEKEEIQGEDMEKKRVGSRQEKRGSKGKR